MWVMRVMWAVQASRLLGCLLAGPAAAAFMAPQRPARCPRAGQLSSLARLLGRLPQLAEVAAQREALGEKAGEAERRLAALVEEKHSMVLQLKQVGAGCWACLCWVLGCGGWAAGRFAALWSAGPPTPALFGRVQVSGGWRWAERVPRGW